MLARRIALITLLFALSVVASHRSTTMPTLLPAPAQVHATAFCGFDCCENLKVRFHVPIYSHVEPPAPEVVAWHRNDATAKVPMRFRLTYCKDTNLNDCVGYEGTFDVLGGFHFTQPSVVVPTNCRSQIGDLPSNRIAMPYEPSEVFGETCDTSVWATEPCFADGDHFLQVRRSWYDHNPYQGSWNWCLKAITAWSDGTSATSDVNANSVPDIDDPVFFDQVNFNTDTATCPSQDLYQYNGDYAYTLTVSDINGEECFPGTNTGGVVDPPVQQLELCVSAHFVPIP